MQMQKYTTNRVAFNHNRSSSLGNYDELCHTRKRESSSKKTSFDNINQDSEMNCTELCPLNSNNLCEKHYNNNVVEEKRLDSNELPNLHRVTNTSKRLSSPTLVLSPKVEIMGHRRTLSLKQQFEFGYDYLLSEIEHAKEFAGKTVTTATTAVWKVCNFSNLPKWMQDNEYLHTGHRPPLPTFWDCIKSIFRLHTETGNIWTHGLGALLFVGLFIYEFVTISAHKTAMDRLMITIYFCGIILCLLFSCMFHTFSCYASPKVIKIFSKLDYCGISLQIIGSMTPALYYGFYEDISMFKLYISFGIVLCILSICVSLWDKFGEPQYRSFRAMVFLCFGLSNVIPGVHWYIVLDSKLLTAYYLFLLQGALYVIGSLLYANRIPERIFPGKCDYMFQSHQIFHVLVVLAALVHLNGINSMAELRTHNRIMMHKDETITSTLSGIIS